MHARPTSMVHSPVEILTLAQYKMGGVGILFATKFALRSL